MSSTCRPRSSSSRTTVASSVAPPSTGAEMRWVSSSVRGASAATVARISPITGRSPLERGWISMTSRPPMPFSSSGVPAAMTLPWSTITMSRASWSASSRYCVVSSTSVPSATSERIASHNSARLRGSRPVVGSSKSSRRGRPTRLAPRSSRRRIPPEYVRTSRSPASARPRRSRTASAARRDPVRSRPKSRATISRFSRPVIAGSTDAYCPASPITRRTERGSANASMPATCSDPEVGCSSVATAEMNVVFPAPFGPSRAVTRPEWATRSRPSSAWTSP